LPVLFFFTVLGVRLHCRLPLTCCVKWRHLFYWSVFEAARCRVPNVGGVCVDTPLNRCATTPCRIIVSTSTDKSRGKAQEEATLPRRRRTSCCTPNDQIARTLVTCVREPLPRTSLPYARSLQTTASAKSSLPSVLRLHFCPMAITAGWYPQGLHGLPPPYSAGKSTAHALSHRARLPCAKKPTRPSGPALAVVLPQATLTRSTQGPHSPARGLCHNLAGEHLHPQTARRSDPQYSCWRASKAARLRAVNIVPAARALKDRGWTGTIAQRTKRSPLKDRVQRVDLTARRAAASHSGWGD